MKGLVEKGGQKAYTDRHTHKKRVEEGKKRDIIVLCVPPAYL